MRQIRRRCRAYRLRSALVYYHVGERLHSLWCGNAHFGFVIKLSGVFGHANSEEHIAPDGFPENTDVRGLFFLFLSLLYKVFGRHSCTAELLLCLIFSLIRWAGPLARCPPTPLPTTTRQRNTTPHPKRCASSRLCPSRSRLIPLSHSLYPRYNFHFDIETILPSARQSQQTLLKQLTIFKRSFYNLKINSNLRTHIPINRRSTRVEPTGRRSVVVLLSRTGERHTVHSTSHVGSSFSPDARRSRCSSDKRSTFRPVK